MAGEVLARRSLDLGADLAAPRASRVFVRDLLGTGTLTLDAVELVVSEFVTNAVLHGRPPIRVSISRTSDVVRIEVGDDGPGLPSIRRPDWTTTSGRGLQIVDLLATRWGIDVLDHGGKVVWAEFPAGGSSGPMERLGPRAATGSPGQT